MCMILHEGEYRRIKIMACLYFLADFRCLPGSDWFHVNKWCKCLSPLLSDPWTLIQVFPPPFF